MNYNKRPHEIKENRVAAHVLRVRKNDGEQQRRQRYKAQEQQHKHSGVNGWKRHSTKSTSGRGSSSTF
ncbi:hypothetical protein JB92DRAFT_2887373 [Gautieria morchelliformis]|nr:hypothetical protein JB92DRAFT_2887373 [Gautieria morchelliformis]